MNQILKYKTFCLTGTLANMTRDQARKAIEDRGGTFTNTMRSGVSYLVVANDKPGATKINEAVAKGVKQITEARFTEMLNGNIYGAPVYYDSTTKIVKEKPKAVPEPSPIFEIREW